MAYELIEHIEVGSGGAASIEFTSIPQDGVDLVLKYSLRIDQDTFYRVGIRFNSDSGDNYSAVRLDGNGFGASSANSSGISVGRGGAASGTSSTSNTFGNTSLYISNYASTSDKSFSVDGVSENNSSSALQQIIAGSYSTSSGITSLELVFPTALEYRTASLYKIY